MVDHLDVSYLYRKHGVFYFSKRVPCDVRSYYNRDRIVICLKTKSSVSALVIFSDNFLVISEIFVIY